MFRSKERGFHIPEKVINNVKFYITVPLKITGKTYNENILIAFLNLNNTYFIFEIVNEEEFDEAIMVMQDVGLPKHKCFLVPKNIMLIFGNEFEKHCRKNGLNYSIDLRGGDAHDNTREGNTT